MDEKAKKVQAVKREILDKLNEVITESADGILSRALSSLSDSPASKQLSCTRSLHDASWDG